MVISKTPLRISFFGGGTDLEKFTCEEDGAVLSCTIDKYIYVIVKASKDNKIHIKYFEQENVDCIDEIKHTIVREAMRKTGIIGYVEVEILTEVPYTGTGLGSSSSLTVGLLNAFYAYKNEEVSDEELARQACDIEISILRKTIGKQDQYIAAYGGLNIIRFKPDSTVSVQPIDPGYDIYSALQKYLLLFYTGIGRKAESILEEQTKHISCTRPILRKMKEQVEVAYNIILSNNLEQIGPLMQEGWNMKRQLASEISNERIDELIELAIKAGATGTKITGAGGGGFILVFCEPEKKYMVRRALSQLKEFRFSFDKCGTQLLWDEAAIAECLTNRAILG